MRLFYSCQGEYICKRLFVFMLQQLVRKEKKSNFPKWTLLEREVNSDSLQIWRSHCSCTLWSVWTCHPFKKRNLGYSESKKTKVLRVCFPSASGLIDWKIIWMPSGDSRSPFHSTLRLMHPNNTNKRGLQSLQRGSSAPNIITHCVLSVKSKQLPGLWWRSRAPTRARACCWVTQPVQWYAKKALCFLIKSTKINKNRIKHRAGGDCKDDDDDDEDNCYQTE